VVVVVEVVEVGAMAVAVAQIFASTLWSRCVVLNKSTKAWKQERRGKEAFQ
jgi:hypothetical protein